ncbi:YycH family regulatory protein [Anaerobacillus sp. MEB173]|uniref:YycH family regulatory protein n=1 Tax=Anaerobacillus sp. MEB173 TaxID=3383345 RepID=UPI003F8E7077
MLEHIKTVILTALVLMSVVLTWQLWTFQPDYGLLKRDDKGYVENNPIGETLSISKVIQPESMIVFDHGQSHLLYPKEPLFHQFYEKMKELTFSDVRYLTNNEILSLSTYQKSGIEVVFPSIVPIDVFKEAFKLEGLQFSMKGINQMEMFIEQNSSGQVVAVRFYSYDEQKVIQTTANLTVDEFLTHFLDGVDTLPAAFAYPIVDGDHLFNRKIYLPKGELQVDGLTYTSTLLSPDRFKQALFSDPSYAKHYRQSERQESYTDGNRMLNVLYSGNILFYINPGYSEQHDKNGKNVVISSVDFINGHGGWTDQYIFYDWNVDETKEEALFRLVVSGVPVFSASHQKVAELYISRIGNQTYEYIRPLFDLDESPIDANLQYALPSGEAVINKIESSEGFDPSLLQKVTIGYSMTKNNSIITFQPEWFVLYNGKWDVVDFHDETDDEVIANDEVDREAEANGLE